MSDEALDIFISELVQSIDNAVEAGLGKAAIIAELRYQIDIVASDSEIEP